MASNKITLVIGELTDTGSLDSITGELIAAASRITENIECHLLGTGAKDAGQQAVQQALAAKARPVLVYRQDRAPWSAMISLMDLRPDLGDHRQCTMSLESWCKLVRLALDGTIKP